MEVELAVNIEQAVVPVEDQVVSGDLQAPLHHKLEDLIEVGLAQRNMVWVYVC